VPSGKIHAVATVIAAGVLGPGLVILAGQSFQRAVAFTAGCMLGLVITPDLDVRHRTTHSEGIVRRTGGQWAGVAWNLLWLPYAYLIPHHRHPLSHWPLLGTVVRLVYLLALPVLFWWGLSRVSGLPGPAMPPAASAWWWGLGGLALVDTLHALMDRFWPF
jgi:uncharacterized metal-binding protein